MVVNVTVWLGIQPESNKEEVNFASLRRHQRLRGTVGLIMYSGILSLDVEAS